MRSTGGLDGIQGIGLAPPGAGLAIRPVDLEDFHVVVQEEPRQPRAVGAGAHHPDSLDRSEAAQPREELLVAGGCRGELTDAEQAPDRVQRGGDMDIQMRIDSADHGAVGLYDGHVAIPSLA